MTLVNVSKRTATLFQLSLAFIFLLKIIKTDFATNSTKKD